MATTQTQLETVSDAPTDDNQPDALAAIASETAWNSPTLPEFDVFTALADATQVSLEAATEEDTTDNVPVTDGGENAHAAHVSEQLEQARAVAGPEPGIRDADGTETDQQVECGRCESEVLESDMRYDPRWKTVCDECQTELRDQYGDPDPDLRTDGGEEETHAARVNAQLDMADDQEREPLDVGDHVEDRDDPDATMVVIRECDASAGGYFIEEIDETVAEYNDCDPTERVYQVVFASRTDKDLADLVRYPYPRSRLGVVSRVHDRDEETGGEQ